MLSLPTAGLGYRIHVVSLFYCVIRTTLYPCTLDNRGKREYGGKIEAAESRETAIAWRVPYR